MVSSSICPARRVIGLFATVFPARALEKSVGFSAHKRLASTVERGVEFSILARRGLLLDLVILFTTTMPLGVLFENVVVKRSDFSSDMAAHAYLGLALVDRRPPFRGRCYSRRCRS